MAWAHGSTHNGRSWFFHIRVLICHILSCFLKSHSTRFQTTSISAPSPPRPGFPLHLKSDPKSYHKGVHKGQPWAREPGAILFTETQPMSLRGWVTVDRSHHLFQLQFPRLLAKRLDQPDISLQTCREWPGSLSSLCEQLVPSPLSSQSQETRAAPRLPPSGCWLPVSPGDSPSRSCSVKQGGGPL